MGVDAEPHPVGGGILVAAFIRRFAAHPGLARHAGSLPWRLTAEAPAIIAELLRGLAGGYAVREGVAVHETALLEPGATVKPPALIGPRCFIAASALLRGGVLLEEDCSVGPAAELNSAFMFKGSKLAHLNFVGDSLIGEDVNCEAGSIIANHRNELADKHIRISHGGLIIDTGVEKFGALIGDGACIGANAVVAPGALIPPGSIVPRLGLVDQLPGG